MSDYGDYLGKTLDQLQLERLLGVGGMGAVFLARHLIMDVPVAVKIMPPHLANDPVYKERFFREAREAAKLDHPNIVKITWMGEQDGALFLAMEYMNGGNVGTLIDDHGPMPIDEALRIIIPVADALHFAHERGIVHRDVKPDNILLAADDPPTPKIADFGLVRKMDAGDNNPTITRAGEAIGTPAFMPLEQWDGVGVDRRADVYALGVSLYFMISAQLPIAEEGISVLVSKLVQGNQTPLGQVLPGVSPELAEIVHYAIAPQAADRFPTAKAFADALREWQAGGRRGGVGAGTKLKRPRAVSAPPTTGGNNFAPTRAPRTGRGGSGGAGTSSATRDVAPEYGSSPQYAAVGDSKTRPGYERGGTKQKPRSRVPQTRPGSVIRDGHETGPIPDIRASRGHATAPTRRPRHTPLHAKKPSNVGGIVAGVIGVVTLVGIGIIGVTLSGGSNSPEPSPPPADTPNSTAADTPPTNANVPADSVKLAVERFGKMADQAQTERQAVDVRKQLDAYLESFPAHTAALSEIRHRLRQIELESEVAGLIEHIRTTEAPELAANLLRNIEETVSANADVPDLQARFAPEMPRLDAMRKIHDVVTEAARLGTSEARQAAAHRLDTLQTDHGTLPGIPAMIEAAKRRIGVGSGESSTPTPSGEATPLPPVDPTWGGRLGDDVRPIPINQVLGPFESAGFGQLLFGFELPDHRDLTIEMKVDAPDNVTNVMGFALHDADHHRAMAVAAITQGTQQLFYVGAPGRFVIRVAGQTANRYTFTLRVSAQPVRHSHMSYDRAVVLASGQVSPTVDFDFNAWFRFDTDRPGWRRVRVQTAFSAQDTSYINVFRIRDDRDGAWLPLTKLLTRGTTSDTFDFFLPVEPGRYALQVFSSRILSGRVAAHISDTLTPAVPAPTPTGWSAVPTNFSGGTLSDKHRIAAGSYTISTPIVVAEGAQVVVEPGVRLRMGSNAGIEVRGEWWAEGTRDRPIVIEPAVPDQPWHNLLIQGDRARSVMRFVHIRGGGGRPGELQGANLNVVLNPQRTGRIAGGVLLMNARTAINVFEDCIIEDCRAVGVAQETGSGYCGGLYASVSALHMIRCTIRRNSADRDGGGLQIHNHSFARLDECEIVQNTAARGGGGLTTTSHSYVVMRGVLIADNRATSAGGFFAAYDAPLECIECVFRQNIATGTGGGGVVQAAVRFINCQFRDNQAASAGGVIIMHVDTCGFWNTRFEGNSGEYGGAIYVSDAIPYFFGCVARNNRAAQYGPTIYGNFSNSTTFPGFAKETTLQTGIDTEGPADIAIAWRR